MGTGRYKRLVEEILSPSGITISGDNPWDIRIKDERFYRRVISDGSLGLGESYMDGWWECERLDDFFFRLIPSCPEDKIKKNWRSLFHVLTAALLNRGSRSRAFHIGKRHYDIGNDLFKNMLDSTMVYSCAYWKEAQDLDHAQEAKWDLICRKLGLCPGDRVLDIGCGWGSFANYAAGKYGVEVVGVTVSKEQAAVGKELCRGLPVEIRLQDYRDVKDKFDHIVSVGMFEHVGRKNYKTYMEAVRRCLKDDGLFLLHTIGAAKTKGVNDPWFEEYIFPNSLIPSMKQISASAEGLFVVEDWHNLGSHYDATLIAWFKNFDSNWHKLKENYGGRFYRMWKYYLLSSAAVFRSRYLQVWQVVFSKNGVPGGYRSIR